MNNQIKISCSNIWKLYGENPEKFLKETKNKPTTEQLKLNKYIPAVRDASIDVTDFEGEAEGWRIVKEFAWEHQLPLSTQVRIAGKLIN